jgi:hypothetical protein
VGRQPWPAGGATSGGGDWGGEERGKLTLGC